MNRYTEIQVFNIPYIKVIVPVKDSPEGEYIACNYKKIEEEVLRKIIKEHYPITGLEAKFIRHFFGMNMKDFGNIFSITNAAVCKWEKKKTPLDLPNQIAMRSFVCKKLNLKT
jgi:DNA-binding transcriptional regulator YiaG